MHLHFNFPESFLITRGLKEVWDRGNTFGTLTKSSVTTLDELKPLLADVDAMILWNRPILDEATLAAAPKLKYLGFLHLYRPGAEAALNSGIALSETHTLFSPSVSEMALGLILNGLRKISAQHMAMRARTEIWPAGHPHLVDPLERRLTGRNVGLVGFGGIGRNLAALLAPFKTTIRAHDPYASKDAAAKLGVTLTSLDEVLAESEIVVLGAVDTAETRGMIGTEQIALLRPNAVLVNVSRGSLIQTPALIARLRRGDLIALCDVFDPEPLAPDSPLRDLPNFFGTPHRAGGLIETFAQHLNTLMDDLEAELAGRTRQFPITREMLHSLPTP